MKTKQLRAITAAVLAALMVLALSACGGGASANAPADTTTAAADTTTAAADTTTAAADTTTAAADTTTAAADTTTAAVAADTATPNTNVAMNSSATTTGNPNWNTAYTDTQTVTISNEESSGYVFAAGETLSDNLWTRRWKQNYNVDVQTVWTSSDYATKLNLAIASQDLPDMFHCDNVQFSQLVQAGLLEDITDAYNQMASPGIVTIMNKDPEMFNTAFSNGKMYGMPRLHYGYECEPAYLWIRKDWYAAAGSPAIATMDDFENLMKTFKQQNNSPYALSCDKYLETFWYSCAGFHAPMRDGTTSRMWVDDGNGGIMSAYEMTPQIKTMLTYWSRWYQEGLIRPDFTDLENSDQTADITSGNTGLDFGANWDGWVWTDVVKNFGNDAYLQANDLPSVDGNTVMYPVAFINDGYGVVKKGVTNPDVLIKLIDDYCYVLNEATVQGGMTPEEVLPFTSNNMHHVTGPFKVLFRSYDDVRQVVNNIDTGQQNFSTGYARSYYDEIMKWINDKDITSLGRYVQQGYDTASLMRGCNYEDNNQFLLTKNWGGPTQEESDNGSILDDIINEGLTLIITGQQPVDYYDTILANWKSAGGDAMTAAVNAEYGNK